MQQTSRALLAQRQLLAPAHRAMGFSVWEKIRDRFKPVRHLDSFFEPDGQNYQSQLPEGYRLHGNTAQSFSASVTNSSFELHQWHEMESVVHSQFGTVDNPVLVFTSDSSWRIVICMGPGIEDDAHSHEKIFYMVREGPMNRCQVCGQCFKIVRLKDEISETDDYYNMMFSTLSHFDVAEEDMVINLTSLFGDRPQGAVQTLPTTNVYIHVNADESDRILIDPAYKLERLKEAHEKLYAMHEAYRTVDEQLSRNVTPLKVPYGRDMYESWIGIEKSIRKFDRIWNRVEKFDARKFSDPVNHARREKRMLEAKNKRWNENFTYFFGGLTEEEQQYRDYFQTDLEIDPEDDYMEDLIDAEEMAYERQFDHKRFDFVETSMLQDPHENFDDLIEDKLFKWRYRQNSDEPEVYNRRMARVVDRFIERCKTRPAGVETHLIDLYKQDAKDRSLAQVLLEESKYAQTARDTTAISRKYMVDEGLQQYRDYYETDAEEQQAFEYLDNLDNRGRIRFVECFRDFTQNKFGKKDFALIPKREFNPELSSWSNMVLDIVDYRDRVRPMANDLALFDATRKYQSQSIDTVLAEEEERRVRAANTFLDREVDMPYESASQTWMNPEMEESISLKMEAINKQMNAMVMQQPSEELSEGELSAGELPEQSSLEQESEEVAAAEPADEEPASEASEASEEKKE